MNLLTKIKELLKKHNVKFEANLGDLDSSDDLFQIFENLTPSRFLHYDPECIDDNNSYIRLLLQHAEITQSEFEPKNISVEGSLNKTITLKFEYLNKLRKFKIFQDESSWVADDFYDRLNKFTQKELDSRYFILPTIDQTTAVVYLPKKVVNIINKNYLGIQSADDIVEFLSHGGLPEHINWNYTAPDVYDSFTSKGETIATAIHKANLPGSPYPPFTVTEGFFEQFLDATPLNIYLQNKQGETPYQLALKGESDILKALLGRENKEWISFNTLISKKVFGSLLHVTEEMLKIIEPLGECLESMKFGSNSSPHEILFSSDDNFITGENSFSIASWKNSSFPIKSIESCKKEPYYKVFIQKSGNSAHTINRYYSENEIGDIRTLINKYCTNTLWSDGV